MADNLEQKANNNGALAPKKSVELAFAGLMVRNQEPGEWILTPLYNYKKGINHFYLFLWE